MVAEVVIVFIVVVVVMVVVMVVVIVVVVMDDVVMVVVVMVVVDMDVVVFVVVVAIIIDSIFLKRRTGPRFKPEPSQTTLGLSKLELLSSRHIFLECGIKQICFFPQSIIIEKPLVTMVENRKNTDRIAIQSFTVPRAR